MSKEQKSLSLDSDIIQKVEIQAKKERRNFTNMIEIMAEYYLTNNKEK